MPDAERKELKLKIETAHRLNKILADNLLKECQRDSLPLQVVWLLVLLSVVCSTVAVVLALSK